jgi:hypothetical protein
VVLVGADGEGGGCGAVACTSSRTETSKTLTAGASRGGSPGTVYD